MFGFAIPIVYLVVWTSSDFSGEALKSYFVIFAAVIFYSLCIYGVWRKSKSRSKKVKSLWKPLAILMISSWNWLIVYLLLFGLLSMGVNTINIWTPYSTDFLIRYLMAFFLIVLVFSYWQSSRLWKRYIRSKASSENGWTLIRFGAIYSSGVVLVYSNVIPGGLPRAEELEFYGLLGLMGAFFLLPAAIYMLYPIFYLLSKGLDTYPKPSAP